jgi:hypothetical protein
MPVGLTTREEVQAQFIDKLRTDAATQHGAELLQTPLEELKTHIQQRLSGNGKKPAAPPGKSAPAIYLIYDQRDAEAVIPLIKFLAREKRYQVKVPLVDEEAAEAAEASAAETHRRHLTQCDAVLLYYGKGKQVWFDNKLADLEKLAGLDRERPLAARAIYLAAPETPPKMAVYDPDSIIIEQYGPFAPADLTDLVARLDAAGKGARDAGN